MLKSASLILFVASAVFLTAAAPIPGNLITGYPASGQQGTSASVTATTAGQSVTTITVTTGTGTIITPTTTWSGNSVTITFTLPSYEPHGDNTVYVNVKDTTCVDDAEIEVRP